MNKNYEFNELINGPARMGYCIEIFMPEQCITNMLDKCVCFGTLNFWPIWPWGWIWVSRLERGAKFLYGTVDRVA